MTTNRRQSLMAALVAITFSLATIPAQAQWTQTATLTASDGTFSDLFGGSLAVDGNTLVVGAPGRNLFTGAAYVFTESNGVWTQVAELTASDAVPGLDFGGSVAISGNTVVVGADACCVFNVAGAAYVFVKPATGWANMTQTAKLNSSDGNSVSSFPSSVAIFNDTIAAGDWQHQVGNNQDQGAAYIFVKPANGWTNMNQTAELTASDGTQNDNLGVSLALRGSTLVVGARLLNSPDGEGAAYVFEKPASGWANGQETAKLTATDPNSFALLGLTVAVSADESTIVAGAPRRSTGGPEGAAYIFSKPASGWQSATQSSELIAPGPALFFGSVAMNGPGTIIAVGASSTIFNATRNAGDAYVYRKPAAGWPPLPQANAKLNPPSPQRNGYFGQHMAVRATTVFAGEYGATINGNANQGAVYVFDRK